MALPLASIALTVLFLIGIACIWRFLNWVWFRPKQLEKFLKRQGLKGNSYRILYGDFPDMAEMIKQANSKPIDLTDNIYARVAPFFEKTIKNYGKRSFVWLGPTPMVLITDPELTKEILTKMHDFRKVVDNPLVSFLASGFINYEGEKWAKHRKIISPAFHQEKLKLMTPAFYESCNDLIEEWKKLVPTEGSSEFDIWPYLQNLTRDVISRTAFGSSYKEGERIFELLKQLTDVTLPVIQSLYIPGWRFLPTKTNRKLKELDEGIQTAIKGIISKREKAIKASHLVESHDLLGILMDSNSQEIQEHRHKKNSGMSIKEVIDECKLFYLAGQETSSVLLVWTMILLGKYPKWQSRAREEVLKVFGEKEPDFDGLNQLKVVTMILYEVLRLYSPVAGLNRCAPRTTKVGDLVLPGGVVIAMLTMFMHYEHELWGEDASEFNPERFSEGISKATKNQVCYFPFAWGPRICIGQNFSLIEAKMAIAMILKNFSFELSPSYVHAPQSIFTVHPQHGAPLILNKLC